MPQSSGESRSNLTVSFLLSRHGNCPCLQGTVWHSNSCRHVRVGSGRWHVHPSPPACPFALCLEPSRSSLLAVLNMQVVVPATLPCCATGPWKSPLLCCCTLSLPTTLSRAPSQPLLALTPLLSSSRTPVNSLVLAQCSWRSWVPGCCDLLHPSQLVSGCGAVGGSSPLFLDLSLCGLGFAEDRVHREENRCLRGAALGG